MGIQYKQLTLEERERIYALKEQRKSFRDIAKILGRNHRTIAREYGRNRYAGQEYIACKAQVISVKRSIGQRTKAPLKNVETFLYVREKLRGNNWSPERIAGRLSHEYPNESIVPETIYQYIYKTAKRKEQFCKYLTICQDNKSRRQNSEEQDPVYSRFTESNS